MTFRALCFPVVCVLAFSAAACGSATSPDASTSPVALPAAGEIFGHVIDNVTGKDLAAVEVVVISAANSGKSTTTDSTGSFRMSGLDLSGTTTMRGSLAGYDPQTVSVTGTSQNIANIKLTPSSNSVITDSVTDTIAATDSACTGAAGACKGYQVVTHVQGAWDATLAWVDPGATLTLELWRNNVRVQSGAASGTQTVRLQATLPAGSYELRVRYQNGTAATSFTLSGTRPS